MIKKYGKPIDIVKFKRATLNKGVLDALAREYGRLGISISKDPRSRKINKCPLCGSGDKQRVQKIYSIGYNACGRCGALYTGVHMPPESSIEFYKEDGHHRELTYADKKTYRFRAREVSSPKIDFVSPLVRTRRKRWLDVGSGMGDVVYNLGRKGFKALGLEVNRRSIGFAKKVLGITLEPKTILEVLKEKGPGSFDVVSYFGVLEHVSDPMDQIACAVELLVPGGLLVVEVPNAESFSVMADKFFPDSVVRQMVPSDHVTLYSEKTLLTLARRFKLKAEAMWFIGLDFYNLILHLGMRIPGFLESDVCGKLLGFNNKLQQVFDDQGMSDQILFVARKRQK